MATKVLDELPRVYCKRCATTVNRSRSNLREAVDFCYHIVGVKTGYVLYTSNDYDALEEHLMENYSPSIRSDYTIITCDGRKIK